MIEQKEYYGNYWTNDCSFDPRKTINFSFKPETRAEDMVKYAIQIAKRYNCKITKPVEYHPAPIGGIISFEVECHQFTYKYFYDGGILQHYGNTEVTEKDIEKYERLFGTRKCIHKDFKKKFWYSSNWNREIREFQTLKKAREAAAKEIGMTVWIYTNFPYGRPSEIVCKTNASGITPP